MSFAVKSFSVLRSTFVIQQQQNKTNYFTINNGTRERVEWVGQEEEVVQLDRRERAPEFVVSHRWSKGKRSVEEERVKRTTTV